MTTTETWIDKRLERLGLAGRVEDWAERYLTTDEVVDPSLARPRQRFEALARFIRDLLAARWIKTRQTRERENPKRVYYLSLEFLVGRSLVNNIVNLLAEPLVQKAIQKTGIDLDKLTEFEPDAGLGNGGLGRLAACFVESLATLQLSSMGYGLRYQYGIFKQEIDNGWQVEKPDNWLRRPDPWEVARPGKAVRVPLNASIKMEDGHLRLLPGHPSTLFGIAYDRPVVGYGGKCVNTMRLWGAVAPDTFDFADFSSGDFVGAVLGNVAAETVTRVLYPDDSTEAGRTLRFIQQYFLVSCSLSDITSRFRKSGNPQWTDLPNKVAIQFNDTHPSLAVAELMRILLDQGGLGWEEAWDVTVRTLGYTNHTLLPEALEKWPVRLFEALIPRHLEIIYEINRRFLTEVRHKYPGDEGKLARMSLIEEGEVRKVRMAHLGIVGSHSVNGVAAIHTELLKTRVVPDFALMYPERFNNKTNGVTPRRWLLMANPALANLITETLGDTAWVTDMMQLRKLLPLADDAGFREKFRKAKREAKARFVNWLQVTHKITVNPESIFDSQVKRIHEYKRQLLNLLGIVVHYNHLKANPALDAPPRTYFFAGKAAPAYRMAKLIIKLINSVADTIDADLTMNGRLKVVYLPDYNVSLAEKLIPASDLSEQISTAGYEASGTGNMKFMMNGALTIGTRDGATIEMAEEAGEHNLFLFGLTAEQVASSRGWYSPMWHYENEPDIHAALDLIFSDHFNRNEPGIFGPIREKLLGGDYYMHLADLGAYVKTQEQVGKLYRDPEAWVRKAIINVACSGKFSSDRTISEYAAHIWGAEPCPVS